MGAVFLVYHVWDYRSHSFKLYVPQQSNISLNSRSFYFNISCNELNFGHYDWKNKILYDVNYKLSYTIPCLIPILHCVIKLIPNFEIGSTI